MKKNYQESGYTLIEIIIVIVVIGVLAGLTYLTFRSYQRGTETHDSVLLIKKALSTAKERTIASKGASRWGAHFENNNYVLYKVDLTVNQNDGYSAATVGNETFSLLKNTQICEIVLTNTENIAVSSVYYQYLDGVNDQISGTIKVCNTRDNSFYEIVNIEKVAQAETSAPISTTDESRHLHFNMDEDITKTTTLRFNFTSDSKVFDVSFLNYLSGSEFFWSDIFTVNSSEQRLKIHSHELSDTEAILSIHRDERYNSRPLTISLIDLNGDGSGSDDLQIVSYSESGTATKGSSGSIEMYQQ